MTLQEQESVQVKEEVKEEVLEPVLDQETAHLAMNELKGGKKYMEDAQLRLKYRLRCGKCIIGGIFDGHGEYNGFVAATTARDYAIKILDQNSENFNTWSHQDISTFLFNLSRGMHQEIILNLVKLQSGNYVDSIGIVRTFYGEPVRGGTTSTIVVDIENTDGSHTIISANTGDSLARVIFPGGGDYALTTTHAPDNVDEFRRIKALKITQKVYPVYDIPKNPVKYGLPHVFNDEGIMNDVPINSMKNNVRGGRGMYMVSDTRTGIPHISIAMTRTIGDAYAQPYGITWEPSINIYTIPAATVYTIVIASDGLWDVWHFDKMAEYYWNCRADSNNEIATKALFDMSIIEANRCFGEKNRDDTTLITWTQQ